MSWTGARVGQPLGVVCSGGLRRGERGGRDCLGRVHLRLGSTRRAERDEHGPADQRDGACQQRQADAVDEGLLACATRSGAPSR